eukprot:gene7842-biopygen22571
MHYMYVRVHATYGGGSQGTANALEEWNVQQERSFQGLIAEKTKHPFCGGHRVRTKSYKEKTQRGGVHVPGGRLRLVADIFPRHLVNHAHAILPGVPQEDPIRCLEWLSGDGMAVADKGGTRVYGGQSGGGMTADRWRTSGGRVADGWRTIAESYPVAQCG